MESRPPTELSVDDRPRIKVVRVGEECPDLFPLGAKKAAAGEPRNFRLPSERSTLSRGIGRSCADEGLALDAIVSDVEEDTSWDSLFFCGRCDNPPRRESGCFLLLRILKKEVLDCDFLGVVLGVVGSVELASDFEDSDCRAVCEARAGPCRLSVACAEGWGSSSVARDGLDRSSLIDLRNGMPVPACEEGMSTILLLSPRGRSCDRRNLLAKLMREAFFLGPIISFVGAVVMISGAVPVELA